MPTPIPTPEQLTTIEAVTTWAEKQFQAVDLDKDALIEWIKVSVTGYVRRRKWAQKGEE